MGLYRRLLLLAGVVGLSLLGHQIASSQEKPPSATPPRLDRGKTAFIEPAVKAVVKNASTPTAPQAVQVPANTIPPNIVNITLQKPWLDFGKMGVIEPRLKGVVTQPGAAPLPAPPRVDVGKRDVIEPAAVAAIKKALSQPAAPTGFVNPKVQPGKVRWHTSFADARTASAKSRKPVLLFQLMGKLDDQFC